MFFIVFGDLYHEHMALPDTRDVSFGVQQMLKASQPPTVHNAH